MEKLQHTKMLPATIGYSTIFKQASLTSLITTSYRLSKHLELSVPILRH
ncbi:hypothetical protein [Xanthomonas oryzae]|nr:hypothetical protein [Xanthomonas oryzae]